MQEPKKLLYRMSRWPQGLACSFPGPSTVCIPATHQSGGCYHFHDPQGPLTPTESGKHRESHVLWRLQCFQHHPALPSKEKASSNVNWTVWSWWWRRGRKRWSKPSCITPLTMMICRRWAVRSATGSICSHCHQSVQQKWRPQTVIALTTRRNS